MDDPDAALARERDRQPRLGDGVHRRRDDRDVELDRARQPRRASRRRSAARRDSAGTSRTSSKVSPSLANLSLERERGARARLRPSSTSHATSPPLDTAPVAKLPRRKLPLSVRAFTSGSRLPLASERVDGDRLRARRPRTRRDCRRAASRGSKRPAPTSSVEAAPAATALAQRLLGRPPGDARGEERGRAARRPSRPPRPARPAARRAEAAHARAPRGAARSSRPRSVISTLRAPSSAIASSAMSEVLVAPRTPGRRAPSASRWFGETSDGSASSPSRSGSPSVSSTARTPRRFEVADRLGVEVRRRRRAAASRRRRRARPPRAR